MITKSAVDENNYKQVIHFTDSAREAWSLILNKLSKSDKVLLPSYIGVTEREGSGIFDPIQASNLAYDFYQLNPDLSISHDEFEKTLSENNYKLVLLVHYFGFKIRNIEKLISICKANNVIVVEDCAHLYSHNLTHISDAGTMGDFAFYSLHKCFPFKSGGLLVVNSDSLGLFSGLSKNKSQCDYSSLILNYKINEIVKKRINNFKFLAESLSDNLHLEIINTYCDGDIPHNFPIIIKNNLREKVYFEMIKKGFTLIALYYNMITPIKEKGFYDSVNLSLNILNLPVHQDTNAEELSQLVICLEEVLIKLNK